ncbi:hypothetical protein BES08_30470 (plasmid) [Novosphingobium resinovorum]|uniref:Uncharacterized protein n=1 Tax=Novosphingobium resinovorum TaxID=158500 RepID=A0A1D8AGF2_9SPHN|nr:hypothetical protein BES08_30470 [Novosphingobium resinovorum]
MFYALVMIVGAWVGAAFDEKRQIVRAILLASATATTRIWRACHQRDDPRGQLHAPASLF